MHARRPLLAAALPLVFVALLLAASASAQDVVQVDSGLVNMTPSAVLDVPIRIVDASGTPLGLDAGSGNEIQSLSLTFLVTPASAVSSVFFLQSGITNGLTPRFVEQAPAIGRDTLVASFDPIVAPIPFNLDAPFPGDQVATLRLILSATVDEGTVINLKIVKATTALGNADASRVETHVNGHLVVVDGTLASLAIFADGFESGDLSAWSLAIPLP